MPSIARITDIGSYHGPFPDTVVIEGSSDMDVNSRALGMVTSPVDCGGFIVTGSPNTTVD